MGEVVPETAIADTSIFIGREQRRFPAEGMPRTLGVCAVTIGELRLGVLAAADPHTRAVRLRTLGDALALDPLPIDDAAADAWAELRITLRQRGRKMPANDSWIAATAIAHGLPLATQDADYDGVPGLTVIKV